VNFGLPVPFRFGLDLAITLGESVEVIPVRPVAVLGSGGSNRLLLRGGMLAVRDSGSAISGLDNNGGLSEDTSEEAFSRRRSPGLLFPVAFDTFVERTWPRDALCPSL
jgi:hypothetical protein